jgi:hypothetical protein
VTTPLASLRALTRILVALLAINAAWAVWDISLLVREISLLERIDLGGLVSFAEGTALEEQILASTNGFGLLFLASVVVWRMWQFRGQRNLTLAGRPSLRFTPGWAVGWWFIPIANLWKPFQAVRELGSRSDPDERSYVVRGWWVVGLWWATWSHQQLHVLVRRRDDLGARRHRGGPGRHRRERGNDRVGGPGDRDRSRRRRSPGPVASRAPPGACQARRGRFGRRAGASGLDCAPCRYGSISTTWPSSPGWS